MTTIDTISDEHLSGAERRGYLSIREGDEVAAARWAERCVGAGRPVVVVRSSGATSTVEYDLTHLTARFAPWAVDAFARWGGFAGGAYGLLRDVPTEAARRLAADVAARASAGHSTAGAATCARLRRQGPWPADDPAAVAARLTTVVDERVAEVGATQLSGRALVRTAAADPGSPAHLAHLLGILDELEGEAPPRRPAA